jgi:transposase
VINPLPIPDELWAKVPPDAQAAIAAAFAVMQRRILELEAKVGELEAKVRDLEARLKLNSTNSSKPPSSDPIGMKRKPPAPRGKRKRGGQPGHRKTQRPLVPPDQVARTVPCKPPACRRCGQALAGEDTDPLVHQVAELPKIQPVVTEYRLHRLVCEFCGETTCGTLPAGIPTGCFGPYLQAVLAMLAGAYRLSKRQIQQMASDLFSLSISTGMISKLERQSAAALEAPYNELAISVHEAKVVNVDETSWRQSRRKVWLWATVTKLATVFTIAANRSREVVTALLGSQDNQVVGSDRYSVYEYILAWWRQVCWAHLRRDFQAMIDRGGQGQQTGERLLALSNRLFRHWHRVRDGTLKWPVFQARMRRLRTEVKQTLEEGSTCGCAKTGATCFEILKVEEGLWTFARVPDVEPTNNVAERAMRHAVIWRKISGGTDSPSGSRFVERMLTVVGTCRQQGRNVLDYLMSCFQATRQGQPIPSLLPTKQKKVKAA